MTDSLCGFVGRMGIGEVDSSQILATHLSLYIIFFYFLACFVLYLSILQGWLEYKTYEIFLNTWSIDDNIFYIVNLRMEDGY